MAGMAAADADAEADAPLGACRNPFCGLPLRSRVAQFCEERANCQRYRAVVLHCAFRRALQSAGAPLPLPAAGGAADDKPQEEPFSIPRRKRKAPEQQQQQQPTPAARKSKKKKRREAEEAQAADALPAEARARLRLGQQRAGAAAAPVAAPTPERTPSVAPATTAGGTTAAGAPARRVTAVAARARQVGIDIVPLGAGIQPINLAGGGRYVQSGNRTAKPTLPPPAVARPPPPPPVPPKPTPIFTGTAAPGGDSRISSRFPPTPPSVVSPHVGSRVVNGPTVNPTSSRSGNGFGRPVDPRLALRNASLNAGPAQEEAKSTRITPGDYLSTRNRDPMPPSTNRPASSSTAGNRPVETSRQPPSSYSYSRDDDDQDFSFSGWEQPNEQHQQAAAGPRRSYDQRPAYHRGEHRSFSRSASYSDDRLSPNGRPDYRRSNSDSIPPAFPRTAIYQDRPPNDTYKYEDGYDNRERNEQYRYDRTGAPTGVPSSRSRDQERIDPYRYNQLPASTTLHEPRPIDHPDTNTRCPDRQTMEPVVHRRIAPSVPEEAEEPRFSGRDRDVRNLISVFICELPHSIGAVKNTTKKPRKMKWYLDYIARTVKLFNDAVRNVKIDIKDKKAVMTVNSCEWLVLEDPSTQELYNRVLLRLLAEGLMWRHMKIEAEKRARDEIKYGNGRSQGVSFIDMWNWFKKSRSQEYVSLEKQVRYICGDTKHHWSFVIGNVEIGSGSHEDMRVAFNMAAEQSMEFLLSLRAPDADRSRRARADQGVEDERYHGSRNYVASPPRTRELHPDSHSHRSHSRDSSERDSFGRDSLLRQSRNGSNSTRDSSRDRSESRTAARSQEFDSRRHRDQGGSERTSVVPAQETREGFDSQRDRSQESLARNAATVLPNAQESHRNSEAQRDPSESFNRHTATVLPQAQSYRGDSNDSGDRSGETSKRTPVADVPKTQESQKASRSLTKDSYAGLKPHQGSSAYIGTPASTDEPMQEAQLPTQQGSRNSELTENPSDATSTSGSEPVSGLQPEFVLRRPPADLRPRNPPQADLRTRGPASNFLAHGPPAKFVAEVDPASDKDQMHGEEESANTQRVYSELSDAEMSISEESDEESTEKPVPPPILPVVKTPSTSTTICHFCSVIRLRKPNDANAKCFRCQSKARNS